MKIIRTLTYESDDIERIQQTLMCSLGEGEHNFGRVKITVTHVEGEKITGIYPMAPRPELSYDKPPITVEELSKKIGLTPEYIRLIVFGEKK